MGTATMDTTALDDKLHRACTEADLAQVQLLIEQGAEVNKIIGPPNQLDYSINIATKTGSVPLARLLLDHGATVNAGALRTAAFGGDLPMLQILLQPIKAHLTTSGMSRKWRVDLASILVGTTRRGRSETAEALKVFRARVDEFDKAVDAGLLAACASGDMQSVKYFKGMGAQNNVDAVSTAAEYNQFEPLQYLLETHSFEPEELSGPLVSAAASGHMESILLLIEQGAEDEGGAALAKAAKFCHASAVQHFLDNFKYLTDELSTGLSAAARAGDPTIMNMLISRGAQGSGALLVAIQRSQLAAVEVLIEKLSFCQAEVSEALEKAMFIWLRPLMRPRKTDLSRTSSFSSKSTADQDTEVMMPEAIQSRTASRSRIVDVLLEAGGRLSELYYCRTLEMMILTHNPYGLEMLEQRSRFTTVDTLPDDYLISLAMYHQHDSIVDALLGLPLACSKEQADPVEINSEQSVNGTTTSWEGNVYSPIPSPLVLAVKNRNEQWCIILLGRQETDINEWCSYRPINRPLSFYGSDKKTQTPREEQYDELGSAFGSDALRDCALSMAVRSGDLAIIRMLIKNGANPWVNRQDISIFELAAKAKCLRDLVLFMEEFTTDFNIDRREWSGGKSMLHWAATYGDSDLINMLCRKGAVIDSMDGLHKTPLHVAVAAGNIDTVKGLLWAGARTSLRDLEDFLCADELAAKMAQQAFWSDPLRAVKFEISRLLEDWVKNNMDHLDAANIRRESTAAEEKATERKNSRVVEDDLLDHFSDEESVHWSDDDE